MITGSVNSKLEAIISLPIYGPRGGMLDVEALIDTGFNGYRTLSPAIISLLELDRVAAGYMTLADGSEVPSDVCSAEVLWDGQMRSVEVDALEAEALVGMELLEGYDLSVRVVLGGRVTIKPASPTQPPIE